MGSSQAGMAHSREKGFPDPSPKGRRWDACALWRGLSRAAFIVFRPARCGRGPGRYINPTAARSTVLTDDWRNCPRMDQKGFEHLALRRGPHTAVRCQLFPWVHITLSNLKRFLLGTHHKIVP